MIKGASITKKKDSYIIVTQSQTIHGLWIGAAYIINIPIPASSEKLVIELLNALNNSKKGVTHPTDWKTPVIDFLKAVKAKSLKAFYQNAKYCNVRELDGIMRFIPTKNVGGKGRFDHLPELEIKVSVKDHDEIYQAIEKTFENCS